MRRRVFLCDFDGTVSPADIGAAFAARFSPDGSAEDPVLLAKWRAGEMGHRELTERQCRLLAVSEEEARAFVRDFTLDPAFAPFVRAARERGDEVFVLSEGFDFYVGERLTAAGLADVGRAANHVRFENGGLVPEFAHTTDGCPGCGTCKASHVRAWSARGFETVLVGDGLSDRCGARAADRVLARGSLRDWCEREGVAFDSFESFTDVAAWAGHDPSRVPAVPS